MSHTTEIQFTISELASEVQIRVNVIAEALRGFLACDVCQETELAMHLVIAELQDEETEADLLEAQIGRMDH